MSITIREIARQFKVRHSTVSRALRDDPRIGETRKILRFDT
ncbi:LacI family DNA-binding transcriptional regulator [bacterium]|nr:LacI family DNA-binding transcriptional regulator [bacterium]